MQIEAGKTYRTRNGSKARILATDINNAHYPVCAAVTEVFGNESVRIYPADGRYFSICGESTFDLVSEWREPVKVSGWVNVYAGDRTSSIWDVRAEADAHAFEGRLACVYVEGTEETP